jgi:hypothetical protein
MNDLTRPKISISDFKNEIKASSLPSFSYLVANHLPEILPYSKKSIIAGIVHPDGYGISQSFDESVQFQIAVENEDKPNLVTILFTGISPEEESITLITSPNWIPGPNSRFPTNAGDLTVAPTLCEKAVGHWRCGVHVGTDKNFAAQKYLGFSFLAVGNTISSKLALHGQVMMNGYEVDAASSYPAEVNVVADFSETGKEFEFSVGEGEKKRVFVKNQRTGGVLLQFEPPFKDVPSLIVSPALKIDDFPPERNQPDIVKIPHIVVEHITATEALVRAGMVDTLSCSGSEMECSADSIFEPIGFSFFAVAPTGDEANGN